MTDISLYCPGPPRRHASLEDNTGHTCRSLLATATKTLEESSPDYVV